jgi:H+-transporting ATPase
MSNKLFHFDEPKIQTLVFVWLVFSAGQATLYVTRTSKHFWEKPYPGKWLLLTTLITVAITVVLAVQGWLMAPISWSLIMLISLLTFAYIIVADLVKVSLSAG